ncbi:MAG: serine/threonine protein kinase [Planctomycetota bacterium]|nr:MAG: serine/threonine protein kinase [Planctomycetota bacterium]
MDEPSEFCACGEPLDVDRVELAFVFRCPACSSEARREHAHRLAAGEVPPAWEELRERLRRRVSSSETLAVLPPGEGPGERTSELRRIDAALRESTPACGPGALGETTPGDGEQPELPAGTELGSFRIEDVLGKGGMGVVYRAHDLALDRPVALKVLSPSLSRNRSFIERFRREARACGKLSHPNITHIYSISRADEPFHYFAMEYVEGEDLAERVRASGPLPVDRALDAVRQTALGLRAASEARIIHRDVKPSNLLLTGGGQVKITDFGLAKAKAAMGHTLDLTSTGVVMGTPLYMSPEQGRGAKVDHRSDIYSLGATLFFLLYGAPPFEADSPVAIILKHINDPLVFPSERDVPAAAKALLLHMMQKSPERRIGDYDELLEGIERARRGEALARAPSQRVFVLSPDARSRRGPGGSSGLRTTRLSVAKTNIKLGRTEKAVSLLRETLSDGDARLRSEAALLLLGIYEAEGDVEGMREMAEAVLAGAPGEAARAYAGWVLAGLEERASLERARAALARYEALLESPPEGLPADVVEAQIQRLRERIAEAEREAAATRVVLRQG